MTKYIISIVALICSVCTYAQEYKAAALYDAQGPVKELITKSENPMTKKKIKFNSDGQLKGKKMEFNEKGYPIGFGDNMSSLMGKLDVTYDSLLNVATIVFETDIIGKQRIEVTNSYEDKRMTSRKIYLSSPKKSGIIISEFSNEKYDDHGNWIERTVIDRGVDENGNAGDEKTYIETRTITYYE